MSRRMCPHGFNLNDGPCEDCDPVAALRDAKEQIERLEDDVSAFEELKAAMRSLRIANLQLRHTVATIIERWDDPNFEREMYLPILKSVLKATKAESEAWFREALLEHAKKTEEE